MYGTEGLDPNAIRRLLSDNCGVKLELMAVEGEMVYLRETFDLKHPRCPVVVVSRGRWERPTLPPGMVPMRDIRMPLIQFRELFDD